MHKLNYVMAITKNFVLLSVLLPLFGCQSGGGGSASASLGSLFGSSFAGSGGGTVASGGGGTEGALASASSLTLTSVHNPEPATMLLLGGGILAMGYVKKHTRS